MVSPLQNNKIFLLGGYYFDKFDGCPNTQMYYLKPPIKDKIKKNMIKNMICTNLHDQVSIVLMNIDVEGPTILQAEPACSCCWQQTRGPSTHNKGFLAYSPPHPSQLPVSRPIKTVLSLHVLKIYINYLLKWHNAPQRMNFMSKVEI